MTLLDFTTLAGIIFAVIWGWSSSSAGKGGRS